MGQDGRESDVARFTRVMRALGDLAVHRTAWVSRKARKRSRPISADFPFVTIAVLIILLTLGCDSPTALASSLSLLRLFFINSDTIFSSKSLNGFSLTVYHLFQ